MLEILPTITFQVLKRLEALLKITIKWALNFCKKRASKHLEGASNHPRITSKCTLRMRLGVILENVPNIFNT